MRTIVHFGLQPVLLATSVGLVLALGTELAYPIVLFGTLVLVSALELWFPARREWLPSASERATTLGIVVLILWLGGLLTFTYQAQLGPPLAAFRTAHEFELWPHGWPMLAQVLVAFFASELGWYWLHRAEHRFAGVWRASGHGVHHSFQRLGALHFSANHPLELLVLLLPMAVLELVFGAGVPAAAATVLLLTNTALAHANLDLNSRGIGWLFTTNRYHLHHHSRVRSESNTNYGCAAILWDRLFGTFADANTEATGIGASEPGLLGKALLPFVEPGDTAVSP